MKFRSKIQFILFCFLSGVCINAFGQYPAGSPVAMNGKLKLIGNQLSNECGNPVMLRGVSSHGMQWFPNCMKDEGLAELVNEWQIDIFRLAMYIPVRDNGYLRNPEYWKSYIDSWVDKCGQLGIYCMIDWHVLYPGDPNAYVDEALDFWKYMATKHKDKKHVLYEICNEPNGYTAEEYLVEWEDVVMYADKVIPAIREIDPSTIIIVGTPNYSQSVDKPSVNPLPYDNIMYTLHFYAGTHTLSLRRLADRALARGIALFITECGTSDASGDGGTFFDSFDDWVEWMTANKLSWITWSFADKNESSALLAPGSCATNKWKNLSASGTYIKSQIATPDNFVACNQAPRVNLITPAVDTTLVEPEAIVLKADATDPNGNIVKVDFYIGNTLLGTVNAPSESYEITLTDIPAGVHTVKAIATDEKGAFGLSQRIVTVNTVDGLFSKAGQYGVAENLFPNPSNTSFSFKVTEKVKRLEVLNIYGEQMETIEAVAPGQVLDLGHSYSNGTYVLKIHYESGKAELYRMIKVR
jgi:aryl-phospho-beta-D-glucosidase BglC (GH1 family)